VRVAEVVLYKDYRFLATAHDVEAKGYKMGDRREAKAFFAGNDKKTASPDEAVGALLLLPIMSDAHFLWKVSLMLFDHEVAVCAVSAFMGTLNQFRRVYLLILSIRRMSKGKYWH